MYSDQNEEDPQNPSRWNEMGQATWNRNLEANLNNTKVQELLLQIIQNNAELESTGQLAMKNTQGFPSGRIAPRMKNIKYHARQSEALRGDAENMCDFQGKPEVQKNMWDPKCTANHPDASYSSEHEHFNIPEKDSGKRKNTELPYYGNMDTGNTSNPFQINNPSSRDIFNSQRSNTRTSYPGYSNLQKPPSKMPRDINQPHFNVPKTHFNPNRGAVPAGGGLLEEISYEQHTGPFSKKFITESANNMQKTEPILKQFGLSCWIVAPSSFGNNILPILPHIGPNESANSR